jgi:hypothetical protein
MKTWPVTSTLANTLEEGEENCMSATCGAQHVGREQSRSTNGQSSQGSIYLPWTAYLYCVALEQCSVGILLVESPDVPCLQAVANVG